MRNIESNYTKIKYAIILALLFLLSQGAQSQIQIKKHRISRVMDAIEKARPFIENEEWKIAESILNQFEVVKDEKDNELYFFMLGLSYLKQDSFLDKAWDAFTQSENIKSNLLDYISFYKGEIKLKEQNYSEAEKYYEKSLSLKPNLRLYQSIKARLAEVYESNGNLDKARKIYFELEKKTRSTEFYPDALFQLASIEMKIQRRILKESSEWPENFERVCKWSRRLYSQYPAYEKIKDWGPQLDSNLLLGNSTKCRVSFNDFKERVRRFLFWGEDNRALIEINELKSKSTEENIFDVDQVLAQYYLQDGEPKKAFDILKKYEKSHALIDDYLNLMVNAAAKLGESELASQLSYQRYQNLGRSKQARGALFQSAFLSYQFKNYDDSEKKFKEFLKVFPKSSLTEDAKWQLAWIRYLKGEYSVAIKELQQIRMHAKHSQDKLDYWKAMSHLKLGENNKAREIFNELIKDKSRSYYSQLAQVRVEKLNLYLLNKKDSLESALFPRKIDRFNTSQFLSFQDSIYSAENSEFDPLLFSVNSEVQPQSETAGSILIQSDEPRSELQTTEIVQQEEGAHDAPKTEIKDPKLALRFQKSRDLQILGLKDWAKWDLYEIEKRTKNKEYLRALMEEYALLGNHHRSAAIAYNQFYFPRVKYGIEGVRFLWEEAFPRAYLDDTLEYSKKFSIPSHLVWSIMRAESQYRKDALSSVGALGLMQIMPATGYRLADKLGIKSFHPNQLMRPTQAIQLGSAYLQKLMKDFNKNIPLVAAAYNAGPHRVLTWLRSFGTRSLDEFIEHIPFLETRNYVKKVVTNFQTYELLYGSQQKINSLFTDSPQVLLPEKISTKEVWEEI